MKELPIPLLKPIDENVRCDTPPMSPNNTQLDEENEIQSDTSPELVDDFEQDEEMSDIIFVSTSMEFATHRPIRIIVHENNSKKMQETKN